jgi:hypothetical protein
MSFAGGVLLLALASVSAPAPEAKAVYKWQFEKGKTFYQEVTTETRQAMKIMGNNVAQTHKQVFIFSFTPQRREGDGWIVREVIEGVKVEIDIGGSKIAYDSTGQQAGDSPLAGFFKALVGTEFTLVLDANTKVVRIEGVEALAHKLAAANPQAGQALALALSEETFKEMATQTFLSLPGREVNRGDTWMRQGTLDMGPLGRITLPYEYTCAGTEGKFVKFRVDNSGFKYEATPGNVGDNPLPFKVRQADLKSKKSGGIIVFDTARGRVDNAESVLELEGKLSIDIGGQVSEIELSQAQKTTVLTTDTNPAKK